MRDDNTILAVNYHYYRDSIPAGGIYPITEQSFKKQLDLLATEYSFISERELIEIIESRITRERQKLCLLTFDDGLKEQMQAARLLYRMDIPAIFYVSTHPIRNNCVSAVHKLHYIRSKMPDAKIAKIMDLKFGLSSFEFDNRILEQQYRYDNELSKKIKYFINFVLTDDEQHYLIDHLFSELVANEKYFSAELYMSYQDIKWLSDRSMLGTHGDEHRPLATLSTQEIKKNINESLGFLEFATNKSGTIQSVSYPYGGPTAVSEKVARTAQECGMKFGLTMLRGVNNNADLHNPMLLKRFDTNDVPGGKSYIQF
ncbi:MAG: polysaccharide deacetylase family protein [Betaproteobacteria bacterium]